LAGTKTAARRKLASQLIVRQKMRQQSSSLALRVNVTPLSKVKLSHLQTDFGLYNNLQGQAGSPKFL